MDVQKEMMAMASFMLLEDVTQFTYANNTNSVDALLQVNSIELTLITPLLLCRQDHHRIPFLFENWLERYIAYDFYMHFRMTRDTFQLLVLLIGPHYLRTNIGGRVAVPLEKCLLMTLWYLAKGETIMSIADRFNVANSTACSIFEDMCQYIVALSDRIIRWPTREEAISVTREFEALAGFPDVIGAVDCCHITITPPANQSDSYLDRKFNYSVALQATCTANKLYTHVFVGYPGSAHDARVFKESTLYKRVLQNVDLFYGQYHLIGDSAYPCKQFLITPFRRTRQLTNEERNFNKVLSATRVKIENSFALLTGRWRILKHVNVYSIRKAILIIISCCILHNFCLTENDFFESCDWMTDDVYEEGGGHDDESGVRKRDILVHYLSSIPSASKKRRTC